MLHELDVLALLAECGIKESVMLQILNKRLNKSATAKY